MSEILEIATEAGKEFIDLTDRVRAVVKRAGVDAGLCQVMVLHSTAAVVVNEFDDPNIGKDVLSALDRAVPDHAGWLHDRIDDNAHAHIKATLLGPSGLVPVKDGDLLLGTWQRILLVELDGPRSRKVSVTILRAP
ncbi:MAG: YjbQ family protein [Myxococcales bacterium]|nr:MAG: YjbQ family protein [Myxococcales bacterium]